MRDFRFTVEQIWLLQRLRGSGLNREQIVAGLEDLDRLDGSCLFNGTVVEIVPSRMKICNDFI